MIISSELSRRYTHIAMTSSRGGLKIRHMPKGLQIPPSFIPQLTSIASFVGRKKEGLGERSRMDLL